jgi:hypothetical protein
MLQKKSHSNLRVIVDCYLHCTVWDRQNTRTSENPLLFYRSMNQKSLSSTAFIASGFVTCAT